MDSESDPISNLFIAYENDSKYFTRVDCDDRDEIYMLVAWCSEYLESDVSSCMLKWDDKSRELYGQVKIGKIEKRYLAEKTILNIIESKYRILL